MIYSKQDTGGSLNIIGAQTNVPNFILNLFKTLSRVIARVFRSSSNILSIHDRYYFGSTDLEIYKTLNGKNRDEFRCQVIRHGKIIEKTGRDALDAHKARLGQLRRRLERSRFNEASEDINDTMYN